MENKLKAKFKFGQKVFTIKNGFLESVTIHAIYVSHYDEVKYSGYKLNQDGTFYKDNTYYENELYSTKKALLKKLENEETE